MPLNFFSEENIRKCLELLNHSQCNLKFRLDIAAGCLDIDLNYLQESILSEQHNHLCYKYAASFLVIYTDVQSENKSLACQLAKDAYELLSENFFNSEHNLNSKFSTGVINLFQQRNNYDALSNKSLIVTGEKKAGIEPGFTALSSKDILLDLFEWCKADTEEIRRIIDLCSGDIEIIAHYLDQNCRSKSSEYLVKSDYHLISSNGKVSLKPEDVQRTSTVQACYKISNVVGELATDCAVWLKQGTAENKNISAVIEVFGANIASIFMQVPDYYLKPTYYIGPNKIPKLLIQSRILSGAQDLGFTPPTPIFGENCINGRSGNYYRARVVDPIGSLESVTDCRVKYEGFFLSLLLGDYDKIGSKLQNMMVLKTNTNSRTGESQFKMVGIDFGHAFNPDKKEIPILYNDGRANNVHLMVPNISALTDLPLSERIKEVFIIAKILGKEINLKTVEHYSDPDFTQQLSKVSANEIEKVIYDYIRAFEILQEMQNCSYDRLLRFLYNLIGTIRNDMELIYNAFESHLRLPPALVNLSQNLTKFTACYYGKASLRVGKSHGLQHILITDNNFSLCWTIKHVPDKQIYRCVLKCTDTKLFNRLQNFSADKALRLSCKGESIYLDFAKKDTKKVCAIFAESIIKKTFLNDDYLQITKANNFLKLHDLTQASWFNEQKLRLQFLFDETKITVTVECFEENLSHTPDFIQFFHDKFFSASCFCLKGTSRIQLVAPADESAEIYQTLLAIQCKCDFIVQLRRIRPLNTEVLCVDEEIKYPKEPYQEEASASNTDSEAEQELFCLLKSYESCITANCDPSFLGILRFFTSFDATTSQGMVSILKKLPHTDVDLDYLNTLFEERLKHLSNKSTNTTIYNYYLPELTLINQITQVIALQKERSSSNTFVI